MWPDEMAGLPSPVPVPRRRSLFERIAENMMPSQGLEGVLSPEQLNSARSTGLTQVGLSLLGGAPNETGAPLSFSQQLARSISQGQGAFRDATGAAAQALALKEQQAALQEAKAEKERVKQSRAAMAAKFPPAQGETPQQTARRLNSMLAEMIAEGIDNDGIRALSGYLAANNALLREEKKEPMEPLDETPNVLDPKTGKPSIRFRDRNTGEVWYEPMKPEEPSFAAQSANEQRQFTRERQLATDYATMSKQFGPVAEYYANANASRNEALAGNAIAQHSLVFNYMHVLEPTSVVREGEYAAVAKRNGVGDRVANLIALVDRGTFLPKQQVQEIQDELDRIVATKQPMLKNRMDQFRRRAERWGVDPANVIFDPFYGTGAGDGSTVPPNGAGAAGGPGDASKLRGGRRP